MRRSFSSPVVFVTEPVIVVSDEVSLLRDCPVLEEEEAVKPGSLEISAPSDRPLDELFELVAF